MSEWNMHYLNRVTGQQGVVSAEGQPDESASGFFERVQRGIADTVGVEPDKIKLLPKSAPARYAKEA